MKANQFRAMMLVLLMVVVSFNDSGDYRLGNDIKSFPSRTPWRMVCSSAIL